MSSSSVTLRTLNTIFKKKYQTEEDFLKDLSNIPLTRLVNFFEITQKTWDINNRTLINRIVTHLNAQAHSGSLNLSLARRLSIAMNAFFSSANSSDKVDTNLVELHCGTDASDKQLMTINKVLLVSSSLVLRKMFKVDMKQKNENSISLPPEINKDTVRHLKEFLETGKIDQAANLALEQLQDLIELAKLWDITELLDYFFNFINDKSFEYFFNYALDAQSIKLFKKCLEFKFGGCDDFKLKVRNFDDFTLKIFKLNPQAKEKLDGICQLLVQGQKNKRLPPLKCFKVQPESRIYLSYKIDLSYPQSLKNMITHINLFHCSFSPFNELLALAKQCKNLQSLSMPKLDSPWQVNELSKLVKNCLPNCPHFKFLNLYFRKIGDVKDLSADPEFTQLITSLNFSECDLTDEKLEFFANICPNLENLNLSKCHEITDKGLETIAKKCPNLTRLNLSYCHKFTGEGLKSLAEGCKKFISLNLSHSCEKKITNEQLKTLVEGCTNLKEFYYETFYNKITDIGLQAIAKHCPHLRNIKLNGDITHNGFNALVQGCPELTALELESFSKEITNKDLETIAESCPKLEHLYLRGSQITNQGLEFLAQGCQGLISLNLFECSHVSNEGLKALAHFCPDLKFLDLTGCREIKNEGIKTLAQGCSKLRSLTLNRCRITSKEVESIKRDHRKLKIDFDPY